MGSEELTNSNDFKPFEGIGLCFSGGGYRATFFALGVVSYLNKIAYQSKPLLNYVRAISSVSGGTILATGYAKFAQQSNPDFKPFFKHFYDTFRPENDKLLETAVDKLKDDSVWKKHPYKKRSLINAFALTYAEMDLFEGDFTIFKEPVSDHLEQICFNATDFSFGLTYRFQNRGYFGNDPLYNESVKKLRFQVQLGDAIASSSCFPLGFEPLIFPDDYFSDHKTADYKELKSRDRFIDGVGIMDGGIADNQGIGSMMLINERLDEKLNLIIVNDVGSFKMVPWEQDDATLKKSPTLNRAIRKILRYFSVKALYWIPLLLGTLLVVLNSLLIFGGTAWTGLYIFGSILIGMGLILTFLGSLALVIKKFILDKIKSAFNKKVPEILLDEIIAFGSLDASLIQRMITDRLTSAAKMINDVFMKQLRRLNYDLFYSKTSLKNRRITTTVYKLNGKKTPYSGDKPNYNEDIKPAPSDLLTSVGLTASETPTTLWWDKTDIAKDRMDTLIACGQFTICYQLMDYILDLRKDKQVAEDDKHINDLYAALETDWKAFNKNPFFYIEDLIN